MMMRGLLLVLLPFSLYGQDVCEDKDNCVELSQFQLQVEDIRKVRVHRSLETAQMKEGGCNTPISLDFDDQTVDACPTGWTCTGSGAHTNKPPHVRDRNVRRRTADNAGSNWFHVGDDQDDDHLAVSDRFMLPANAAKFKLQRSGGSGNVVAVKLASDDSVLCQSTNGVDHFNFVERIIDCPGAGGKMVYLYAEDNLRQGWGKLYMDTLQFLDSNNAVVLGASTCGGAPPAATTWHYLDPSNEAGVCKPPGPDANSEYDSIMLSPLSLADCQTTAEGLGIAGTATGAGVVGISYYSSSQGCLIQYNDNSLDAQFIRDNVPTDGVSLEGPWAGGGGQNGVGFPDRTAGCIHRGAPCPCYVPSAGDGGAETSPCYKFSKAQCAGQRDSRTSIPELGVTLSKRNNQCIPAKNVATTECEPWRNNGEALVPEDAGKNICFASGRSCEPLGALAADVQRYGDDADLVAAGVSGTLADYAS